MHNRASSGAMKEICATKDPSLLAFFEYFDNRLWRHVPDLWSHSPVIVFGLKLLGWLNAFFDPFRFAFKAVCLQLEAGDALQRPFFSNWF